MGQVLREGGGGYKVTEGGLGHRRAAALSWAGLGGGEGRVIGGPMGIGQQGLLVLQWGYGVWKGTGRKGHIAAAFL